MRSEGHLGRVGAAKLVIKAAEDAEPVEHELVDDVTTIGRGGENIITIDDDKCSRRHCVIRRAGDDYRLHDLGSSNGTFVNGDRVSCQTLRHGNVVSAGNATMVFLSPRQAAAREECSTVRESVGPRPLLGAMLVGAGAISDEHLGQALAVQFREGGLLGQILRRSGACTDDEIVGALIEQGRYTRIDLSRLTIPPEVASLVRRDFCEQYCLIPYDVLQWEGIGRMLCVSMANVLDDEALEQVREEYGALVWQSSSSPSDIRKAIERWHPGERGAGAEGTAAEVAGDGSASPTKPDGASPAAGRRAASARSRATAVVLRKPAGRDVFISYRREGGSETARLVRDALAARGFRAFLDVEDLGASRFDERLLREIEGAPSFIAILTPGALDRCADEGDWFRREIAHAVETGRNIIPVAKEGFAFPSPAGLPPAIAELTRRNAVAYSHAYFEAAMDRLVSFLKPAAE